MERGCCDGCGEDGVLSYYEPMDAMFCDDCAGEAADELREMHMRLRAEVWTDWDAVRQMEAWQREANEREPLPVGEGEPW